MGETAWCGGGGGGADEVEGDNDDVEGEEGR